MKEKNGFIYNVTASAVNLCFDQEASTPMLQVESDALEADLLIYATDEQLASLRQSLDTYFQTRKTKPELFEPTTTRQ